MTALVEASSVTRTFGAAALETQVLRGVTVSMEPGELVVLLGPSGSGKTTLVSILAGIMRPTTGEVTLCGEPISKLPESAVARVRRAYVSFVFQSYNLFPALTALDNVASVLRLRRFRAGEARARAAAMLEQVGLAERMAHKPATLSGGQKQRVAIARALVGKPRLLVGDEITAALDWSSAQAVMEIVRSFVSRETGALLVTHDRRLERWADRVVEMSEGCIVRDERLVREGARA